MDNVLTLGYAVGGTGQVSPFDDLFKRSHALNVDDPKSFDDCDAIVIWGGADISPSLYGQPASRWTGADDTPSARDTYEAKCIAIAMSKDIPVIGICRGAQLCCAMAGGILVQHVENHTRTHEIMTDQGKKMLTSSVHHQMMYPWKVQHKLIAWSTEQRSDQYIGGNDKQIEMPDNAKLPDGSVIEPEIVYFPMVRALAIQGHPEFMSKGTAFVDYCNDLVQEYLLVDGVEY